MIITIERGEESIKNISPSFVFQEGDILLLAGEEDRLNSFQKNIMIEKL